MRNAIIIALGLAAGVPSFASLTSFSVSLDMSALPSGIYTFDFNMADGDTVANNTVNVSNFTISDTLLGSLALSPGASGTLASLTLPDDALTFGMSDANQQFSHTMGSGSLSFNFSYNPVFSGIGSPDEFNFTILTGVSPNLTPIVTNMMSNGGGSIQLDFRSTSALPVAFAADPTYGSIDPLLMESPEPASIALTGAGAALLLLLAYRRRRTSRV